MPSSPAIRRASIRPRFPAAIAERLQRLAWWNWDARAAARGFAGFPARYRSRAFLTSTNLPRACMKLRLRSTGLRVIRCPRKAEHRQGRHDERSIVTAQSMQFRIERARALLHGRLEDTSIRLNSETGTITELGSHATAERTIDAIRLSRAAGHRRRSRRRVRAADDAAAGRRISNRRRAPGERSAGCRQWHHHGLSRRDLVVGGRAAGVRTMRAPSLPASNGCGPGSGPTPAITFATRPTISMPSPRSSSGSRHRRIDAIAFNDHMTGTVEASDRARTSWRQWPSDPDGRRRIFSTVIERTRCRADEVPGSIRAARRRRQRERACRCCRTTIPAPSSADGFARSAAAWRNSRPRSRPPRTRHRRATTSFSGRRTSSAAEATPDGSTPPR